MFDESPSMLNIPMKDCRDRSASSNGSKVLKSVHVFSEEEYTSKEKNKKKTSKNCFYV